MSAFMMNPEDHALLGAYLAHHVRGSGVYNPVRKEWIGRDIDNDYDRCMHFARVLAEANLASVNYRYQENEEMDPDHIDEILCRRVGGGQSDAEIYELAASLRYQSCEHPEWIEWDAYWLIDNIIEDAARKMSRLLKHEIEPEIPAAYIH
jgi:hypothetical protein